MPVEDREPAGEASRSLALRDNPCWCGAGDLRPFSPTYSVCGACQTLVTRHPYTAAQFRVEDDSEDFYGRDYWFSHQETDLAQPGILARTRSDLPERALHWLRALLRVKQPPGRALELGSAHGGFAALLRRAGFDASGLELSPWVVAFARDTFDVPMYQGTLEEQQIEPGSLDAILLMDVLEHLPDPFATMQKAVSLLKPDGILVMQTPRYRPPTTYTEMVERDDPFLVQLKTDEHLFLFSENSIRELLRRLGVEHVSFEPAIFGHYDMFVVAGTVPLTTAGEDAIWRALSQTPDGRIVQALLDLADQRDAAEKRCGELVPLGADVEHLKAWIAICEDDRAARLEVIQQQGAMVGERDARIAYLETQCAAAEQDRAERLTAIEALASQIEALTSQIEALASQKEALARRLEAQARQVEPLMKQLEAARQTAGDARGLVERVRQGSVLRFARAVRPQGADAALARAEAILARWERSAPVYSKPEPPPASPPVAAATDPLISQIRDPKTEEAFNYTPAVVEGIERDLIAQGFHVERIAVDPAAYRAYFTAAEYVERYPDYYSFNLPEKSLEHFLASRLLDLKHGDVYVDIASEHSPVPEIYARLFGCVTYCQDLAYPQGLHGDKIGGDAAAMPVPDGFATKMALHCSFEHFEGDADERFIREVGRVLRPGGRVCFAPLYLWDRFGVLTDPAVAVAERVSFDSGATVFCKPGWGNRHGRLYDVAHLHARIRRNLGDLQMTVYRIMNATEVDPSCYIQFAAVIERP